MAADDGPASWAPPEDGADGAERVQPERIGPYLVERTLGEGGFGVVYLAEQRSPLRRRVAVKVIKPGMDSRGVLSRFQQERQALAVMDHPNVARVFDAGSTPEGRPYFVMEYVDGEPLTAFCDRRSLGLRARLSLFLSVCEALQHAHTKGVIHRDLKPGNILVRSGEAGPVVKVIDFGIAKAMDPGAPDQTAMTEQGALMGTVEYMSPEQASLGAQDVDTRADVYALGVVLYELLTGVVPVDRSTLRAAGFDEMRRIIRDDDAPRPSARLAEMGEGAEAPAQRRGLRAADLRAALRRELEWIPLKALRKDRDQRYGSVRDLAEDVRRYLDGRPLRAAPERALYRAGKCVRRNRGKVAFAAALSAALTAGIVVSATFAVREGRQRRRAETSLAQAESARLRAETAERSAQGRAEELERMIAFQERQVAGINAARMGERVRGLTLAGAGGAELESALSSVNFTDVALASLEAEFFDRSLEAVERDFAGQPLLRARLLQALAAALSELGRSERAAPAQAEALRLRRETLGEGHEDTLASMHHMSVLLRRLERLQEAEAMARDALQGRRGLLGDAHPDTLASIDQLGEVLQAQRRFDEAEPLFAEALAGRRAALGDLHPDTLRTINNMGGLLQVQERFAEAEPLLAEALAGRSAALGLDHPDTLNSISNMGLLMERLGRLEEAEGYWTEALLRRRRALGSEHPSTLTSINNMGGLFNEMGEFARARAALEAGEPAARRVLQGENARWLGNYLAKLGEARAGVGDFRAAEAALLEAYELLVGGFEPGNSRIVGCERSLAKMYEAWERAEPGMGHVQQAERWGSRSDSDGAGAGP
ncbi:MAG: serine/threonine protein kinase [Phycisphaerales bacterium]|nr:serine/threonine protein kinase [Phycisphaerales bacterium]